MSGLFSNIPDELNHAPLTGAQREIAWTLDRAVAAFLNRWCHRALGDRADAERELRELIDLASTSRRERTT